MISLVGAALFDRERPAKMSRASLDLKPILNLHELKNDQRIDQRDGDQRVSVGAVGSKKREACDAT